ncbi:MAG: hypothetical protein WBA77_10085 [Microcoleaceae cyanobacterium]
MTNKIIAVNKPNKPEPPATPEPTEVKQEQKPVETTKKLVTRPSPKPQKSFSRPSRTPKPKPRKIPELTEAQNAAGDTFNVGDRIQVRAPWGIWAEAEIDKIYQVNSTDIVAHFVPKTERSGWNWFGGCISSELLQKSPDSE